MITIESLSDEERSLLIEMVEFYIAADEVQYKAMTNLKDPLMDLYSARLKVLEGFRDNLLGKKTIVDTTGQAWQLTPSKEGWYRAEAIYKKNAYPGTPEYEREFINKTREGHMDKVTYVDGLVWLPRTPVKHYCIVQHNDGTEIVWKLGTPVKIVQQWCSGTTTGDAKIFEITRQGSLVVMEGSREILFNPFKLNSFYISGNSLGKSFRYYIRRTDVAEK